MENAPKDIKNTSLSIAARSSANTAIRQNLDHLKRFLLCKNIEDFAKKVGFDLVGFSPAKIEDKYLKPFEDWLGEGRNGTMEYMKKIEQRRDLTRILPGAKSVIVLAINYYRPQQPLRKNHGRIARYAPGRDYHKVIKKMLKKVEEHINRSVAPLAVAISASTAINRSPQVNSTKAANPVTAVNPSSVTRSYVDTGPILERALAQQAGLGRIGKNTCLITKEYGSWVFLAEIITTLDLVEKIALPGERLNHTVAPGQLFGLSQKIDQKVCSGRPSTMEMKITHVSETQYNASITQVPAGQNGQQSQPDRWQDPEAQSFNACGNCTRCITACPTGAIIAPGVVDARLCISYLTIENKNRIPPQLAKIIKKTKRLYGCDICQEVCPHNHARQRICNHESLKSPVIAGDQLSLKKITRISSDQHFLKIFTGSALMRTKRKGLQRNTKAVI